MSGVNNFSLASLKALYPHIYYHARAAALVRGVSPAEFVAAFNAVIQGDSGSPINFKNMEDRLSAVTVVFGGETLPFPDLLNGLSNPACSPGEP